MKGIVDREKGEKQQMEEEKQHIIKGRLEREAKKKKKIVNSVKQNTAFILM